MADHCPVAPPSEPKTNDCSEFSAATLKYTEQILTEDDSDDHLNLFEGSLALQAMEASFYTALRAEPSEGSTISPNGPVIDDSYSSLDGLVVPSSLVSNGRECELQFRRGEEEARKFHQVCTEEGRRREMLVGASDYNEKAEADEMSKAFERLFLYTSEAYKERTTAGGGVDDKAGDRQPQGKKQRRRKEVVDFRRVLMDCAKALDDNDHKAADELLRQIRLDSSPFGDGSQRLAYYFANALEARIAGTGAQIYAAMYHKLSLSATDTLTVREPFFCACPFWIIGHEFIYHYIFNLAEKVKRLHIIDFGIMFGLCWLPVIHHLSTRPGGPPKLRITGIEDPQPGLRPAERVEKAGHRLVKCCERFNVPFEYNGIAQKWETISVKDLKVHNDDEAIAVTCRLRFEQVMGNAIKEECSRTAVLNLIREINPDIFIHFLLNSSYDKAMFVPRFREALCHFSSFFDMLDANLGRENDERMMYERRYLGRDVMNIVACEGSERVERAEVYKQWQLRIARAGFRQRPLDSDHVSKQRTKVKDEYHMDFWIEEDGNWILQGWKGRILYAICCWIPVSKT